MLSIMFSTLRVLATILFVSGLVMFFAAIYGITIPDWAPTCLGIFSGVMLFVAIFVGYFLLPRRALNDDVISILFDRMPRWARICFRIVFFAGLVMFIASGPEISRLRRKPEQRAAYERAQAQMSGSLAVFFSSGCYLIFHSAHLVASKRASELSSPA
jgi:hypothetical protein